MLENTFNLESEDISSHTSSAVDQLCPKDSLVFVSLHWHICRRSIQDAPCLLNAMGSLWA